MTRIRIGVLVLSLVGFTSAGIVPRLHPNVGLGVEELVSKYGFPLETHEAITADGYILTIHRIPHGKADEDARSRQPVLLIHGVLSSSIDWLNVGEEKALGFMLAERGYDVWMGNVRGNTLSRNHTTLDPDVDKAQFWDFSWHEMGYYDLPAIIDLILLETGYKSLQFVGYSQGTTAFFVMASTRPEYNDKIKFAQLLAPVAEMAHFRNPFIKLLARYDMAISQIANRLGIFEVFSWEEFYYNLGLSWCDDGKPMQELCKMFIWAIAGYNREQLEGAFIPVITSNMPAGSSVKQFMHFSQSITNKEFRQFDYGTDLNMQKYQVAQPPTYDLGLITARVALYYGLNDWLASDMDAQSIARKLSHTVLVKAINSFTFNHIDFVWSKDIVTLINNDVIQYMAIYN